MAYIRVMKPMQKTDRAIIHANLLFMKSKTTPKIEHNDDSPIYTGPIYAFMKL